jgi:threonine dehydratase
MPSPTLAELETSAALVHATLPATPQYRWPLLEARVGATVWVKHENHLPVGAFKVRGGLVLMARLRREGVAHVVAASTGNHGQSIAFAARRAGLAATIFVPHGNSVDKNTMMRALGATVREAGHDFQAALEHATRFAADEQLYFVPSFARELVLGVASYALELFRGADPLDVVYVPIGLGSGICGVLAAREALGLTTEVVGVVAAAAPTYALSFAAGGPVATERTDTHADGVACRVPHAEALTTILAGVARIVTVTEPQIRAAMRSLFSATHNTAEGAGAVALAGAMAERERLAGRRIAVILSGGNIDRGAFARILAEPDDP